MAKDNKKNLAWIIGGVAAALIAVRVVSAKKPPEEEGYVVGISNINLTKI